MVKNREYTFHLNNGRVAFRTLGSQEREGVAHGEEVVGYAADGSRYGGGLITGSSVRTDGLRMNHHRM